MENLLNILADCKPHSMPNLTALLTKTPQQIEQSIIALQKLGLNIKVDTIGVHLQPQLDLLDFQRISTALSTKHIFIKSVVDSTNAFLFRNLNQLKKVIFASQSIKLLGVVDVDDNGFHLLQGKLCLVFIGILLQTY